MSDIKKGKEILDRAASDLKLLDSLLIGMYGRRLDVARRVILGKITRTDWEEYPHGEPIVRYLIEEGRLNDVRELATKHGVDPNFAASLEYQLIAESCKYQMNRLQTGKVVLVPPTLSELRTNLLELTAKVTKPTKSGQIPYDISYTDMFPATEAYLEYEAEVIRGQVAELPRYYRAMDVGCATGQHTMELAKRFKEVIAVDISPDMCRVAEQKANSTNTKGTIRVVNADVETPEFWEGIADTSVDFILLSIGTASDLANLDFVAEQISRVLRRNGRAVLSFYNKEALVYQAGFLPWRPALAAVCDLDTDTVTVSATTYVVVPGGDGEEDKEVLTIENENILYAKAYTPLELDERNWFGLRSPDRTTYPTMLSFLPPELCKNEVTRKTFRQLDEDYAEGGEDTGAYVVYLLLKE